MEEKIKYLELVEGSFTQEHFDKQESQNPYVAYSIQDDDVIYSIIPESPYQMVDLGLPSGLKWADRNVGASSSEDYGLYFQWGDTEGYTSDQAGVNKVFDWSTYKFGDEYNLTKYNSTDGLKVLESIDDAATVHMGSQYRMPTMDEIQELIDNTTHTFVDGDGNEYDKQYVWSNNPFESVKFKGMRFIGSNGNSIFIPASGHCAGSLLHEVDFYGQFWSSSLRYTKYYDAAAYLTFHSGGDVNQGGSMRFTGQPVRGVQA